MVLAIWDNVAILRQRHPHRPLHANYETVDVDNSNTCGCADIHQLGFPLKLGSNPCW